MAIYRTTIAAENMEVINSGGSTSGQCIFEIVGAPTDYMLIKSIGFSFAPTAATKFYQIGLGYSSQVGAPPSISSSFIPDNPSSPPTLAYVASQWAGAPPASPTAYLRLGQVTGVNAYPAYWVFPRGLGVNPGTSVGVFYNNSNQSFGPLIMELEIDV